MMFNSTIFPPDTLHTLDAVALGLELREHNRHARKLSGVNAQERIIEEYAESEWVLRER